MSRNPAVVALVIVVAAVFLIAPVMLFRLAMDRQRSAAAANAYESAATCSGPSTRGLPPPAQPLSNSVRDGVPCAMSGAIVTEKDTLSQGIGLTRYALGLRSDAGKEYLATLDDVAAADLWNSIHAGDRVIVQTYAGRVALVGDGARTVRTDSNPSSVARHDRIGIWVTGGMFALEVFAIGMVAAWRRRAAAAP